MTGYPTHWTVSDALHVLREAVREERIDPAVLQSLHQEFGTVLHAGRPKRPPGVSGLLSLPDLTHLQKHCGGFCLHVPKTRTAPVAGTLWDRVVNGLSLAGRTLLQERWGGKQIYIGTRSAGLSKQISKLWDLGYSVPYIAGAVGCSRPTVRRHLRNATNLSRSFT